MAILRIKQADGTWAEVPAIAPDKQAIKAMVDEAVAEAVNLGKDHAGSLLIVGPEGEIAVIGIGAGLKIENGVLMLDGTVTPDTPSKTAICGTFLAGQVLCGEV